MASGILARATSRCCRSCADVRCCCGSARSADHAVAVTLHGPCLGAAVPLPGRRNLPPRSARPRRFRDRQPSRKPIGGARRPWKVCRRSRAAIRWPRRHAPSRCRRWSRSTRPACCWCGAASRSGNAQLDAAAGRAPRLSRQPAAGATTLRRGIALFLIFSLLTALVVHLRRPLSDRPGPEPADDRRRLRA